MLTDKGALLFFGFTMVYGAEDLRNRQIRASHFLPALLTGILYGSLSVLQTGTWAFSSFLSALIPGAVMGIFAKITGTMGAADVVYLILAAFFLDLSRILSLLLWAALFCAVFGLVCCAVSFAPGRSKKSLRNCRLPFLSFFIPAYLLLFLQY